MLCSNKYELEMLSMFLSVSSKGKEIPLYLTHQGHGSIAENTIAPRLLEQKYSVTVNRVIHELNLMVRLRYEW